MKVFEITSVLEAVAPLSVQESYDNAGLLVGDRNMEVANTLLCLDVTEQVIKEAIDNNCNLIISHHPLIFSGLKSITGRNFVEKCMITAIKNDIAIYSAHTNLDNVSVGVNAKLAEKMGLEKCKVLSPKANKLLKLVTFIPADHLDKVRQAIFNAGAGHIGDYDMCSYSGNGSGTFRANENSEPFVGAKGEFHTENEVRFEIILPDYLKSKVVSALIKSHPYEEVAYDVYSLENTFDKLGAGMIGELREELDEEIFLQELKEKLQLHTIKHTNLLGRKVKKIAICGGSGSFLLKKAIAAGADMFVSGDFKYHDYFNAEANIVIADIGHYESERYTIDLFYEILTKKIPNFAVRISEIDTNPIKYY